MTRPNILLIFTDQQRADTIGALGNPVMRTPNLDRLAREGTAFTSAYTPSPVCVAARCSLIHGQYPLHTGCYDNGLMPTDGRQTFMDALTAAGYRTHGIGKCHFTPDGQALRGFQSRERQEELLPDPDLDDYLPHLRAAGFDHITDPHGVRGEMYYIPQPAQMPARLHPTQWVGDRAVSFIRDADEDQPWFLYTGIIHPHPPFAPPAPWHKLYRAPLMPLPNLPPDAESLYTYVNKHQNRYKYRDQGQDLNLFRNMKAYYYACISFIDYQVGRILQALEERGQLDNTLILFASDHGELLGDYGCVGKRSMHDAAARVPLLARLPGQFATGARCETPVSLVDLAPTILAAAGAEIHSHLLDGVDLAQIQNGLSDRQLIFAQHAMGSPADPDERAARSVYMAVSPEWKYFYSAPDGREYLFDRIQDPQETRNRAGTPFCQEARATMQSALIQHLRNNGEEAGLDGDGWRAFPQLEMPVDPDAGLLIQDHSWADQHIPGYNGS